MTDLGIKLKQIDKVFNTDKILGRNSGDTKEVARYYKKNQLAYKLFNSNEGFVHMGISDNGSFSSKDFYKQAKLVQKSISLSSAKSVLELAPGKGATLDYLAERNPAVKFSGIDLENGQLKLDANKPNVSLIHGDYHDLSAYTDESMDVVYVIEALCHAEDKKTVIAEVKRVLKPNGYFVIIDGYFKQDLDKLSEEQLAACRLVAKSMMVTEKDQSYDRLKTFLASSGFEVRDSVDYSTNIMPSLLRLESMAKHLIDKPRRAKPIIKITGEIVAANAIAGYLMPISVEQGLFEYRYTCAIKSPNKTGTK